MLFREKTFDPKDRGSALGRLLLMSAVLWLAGCSSWLGNPPDKDPKGDEDQKARISVDKETNSSLNNLIVEGKDNAGIGLLTLNKAYINIDAFAFQNRFGVYRVLRGPFVYSGVTNELYPSPTAMGFPIGDSERMKIMIAPRDSWDYNDPLNGASIYFEGVLQRDNNTKNISIRLAFTKELSRTLLANDFGERKFTLRIDFKKIFSLSGAEADFLDFTESSIIINDSIYDPKVQAIRRKIIGNIESAVSVQEETPAPASTSTSEGWTTDGAINTHTEVEPISTFP